MKLKDTPLTVEITRGTLIIKIGIDTLAIADKERTGIIVSNTMGFAKDIMRELTNDNEIGATMLTDLFDNVMQKAIDNGTEFAEQIYEMREVS